MISVRISHLLSSVNASMFQTIFPLTIHTLSIALPLPRPVLTHLSSLLPPTFLPNPPLPTENQLRQPGSLRCIHHGACATFVLLQTFEHKVLSTLLPAALTQAVPTQKFPSCIEGKRLLCTLRTPQLCCALDKSLLPVKFLVLLEDIWSSRVVGICVESSLLMINKKGWMTC